MTIAITGATGQLGRLAISALKARGGAADAVALVRSPEKAGDLGIPVRAFDYTKPETLQPALKGVETLVLISSNDFNDRLGQHKSVIDAAKAAGVGHVVYTSILKGDASPMVLAQDHIGTEAYLKASGLPHTVLRNGWYTENYTGSLGGAIAAGAMIGATPSGRVSPAARADYAEAIAVVVTDPSRAGKVYELAGDTALTLAEFAAEVAKVSGKAVGYHPLPEAEYARVLQGFGLPEGFAKILADSDATADKGSLEDNSKTLSTLIGRPTTPVAKTIAAALA